MQGVRGASEKWSLVDPFPVTGDSRPPVKPVAARSGHFVIRWRSCVAYEATDIDLSASDPRSIDAVSGETGVRQLYKRVDASRHMGLATFYACRLFIKVKHVRAGGP